MSHPETTHHFTRQVHNKAYPAIAATLPSLSAHGKTVLITGGSQGIGLAIATGFAAAGAAHIILVARNAATLNEAKKSLENASPATQIYTFTTDISDPEAITALFASIRTNIADPDILVLNAANASIPSPTLSNTASSLSREFSVNVIANMTFLTTYLHPSALNKSKIVLNVSTFAVHQVIPNLAAYGASKLAFLYMCTHLQAEFADRVASGQVKEDVRIMNFHPGVILTSSARGVGMTEESMPWDQPDLPGNFAVWLASEEAAFLKGRMVHATWDVEALKANAEEIVERDLLKIKL